MPNSRSERQVRTATRRPGNRAGLSADQVLDAARSLVGDLGVEALTMRRLADRLGVAPNTLYSHFADKAALVDAFLDSVLADVDVPQIDAVDWRDGVVRLMTASRMMLLAHADLLPYLLSRPMRGPNASRLAEATLAMLERGGIQGQGAVDALRALLTYTFGAVVLDAPRRLEPDTSARVSASREAFRSRTDQPRVARLADSLARPPAEDHFEIGRRWLLAGIEEGRAGPKH